MVCAAQHSEPLADCGGLRTDRRPGPTTREYRCVCARPSLTRASATVAWAAGIFEISATFRREGKIQGWRKSRRPRSLQFGGDRAKGTLEVEGDAGIFYGDQGANYD